MLATLHILFVGAWIGTVLVEALFERALLGQGRAQELALARLHWQVDKLVELPLLIAVVASGAKLLRDVPLDGLLRGDLVARMNALAQGVQNALITPDEGRALDNRPPKGGAADALHIQGATVPLGTQPNGGANASGNTDPQPQA